MLWALVLFHYLLSPHVRLLEILSNIVITPSSQLSHSLYQLKLVGDPNLAQYPDSFDVVGRTDSNLQHAGHSNLTQQGIKVLSFSCMNNVPKHPICSSACTAQP